jgi:uncharacterized protein involved in exopolysaccharide biosynthesis
MDSYADHNASRALVHGVPLAKAGDTGVEIRLMDVGRAIRRNALPVGLCAVFGAAAAYAFATTLPKSYTAYSAIAVGGASLSIPELQGVLRTDTSPDPMPFVRTEVQALQARQLVERVVGTLHLDRDPEFNGALRPPTLPARAIAWLKSLIPTHASPSAAESTNDAVVNAVSHAFAFTQDNRSLVIGISFTAHNPQLAAQAVNQLIGGYIAGREDRRTAADRGANSALTQRIDQVRGDIDNIEKQMRDLRAQSGMVTLRAGSVGQQQVEELTTEAAQAAARRTEIEANLVRAQSAASSGATDELASVLGSETISRLREQESVASGKVADLSARYGPRYPALRSAQADLAAIRHQVAREANRIVASLSSQYAVAKAHEDDVKRQLALAERAGAKAQDVEAQLAQLAQDAATRRELYKTLLVRFQQTVAQPRADELPDVRVLSKATPPGLPSAPNMKLAAGLGGIGGALVAGLIATSWQVGRARFHGDDDIHAATGAAILARLGQRRGKAGWNRVAAGTAVLNGREAAALRGAIGRLGAGRGTGRGTVVGVSGSAPAQSAAIAMAMARVAGADHRVLVIQPDPAEILADDAMHDWRETIEQDGAAAVDVAKLHAAEGETALRVALENLLIEAREEYDLIFLMPAPGEASAPAFVRSADMCVMIIDQAADDRMVTAAAVRRLADATRLPPGLIVLGNA